MSTALSSIGFAQQAVPLVGPPPVIQPEGVPRLLLYPDSRGTGTADILMVYGDANGRVRGELRGELDSAAWKLNSYASAQILLARSQTSEDAVRPGNRLIILFDNGLPAWGGVIDLPRPWNGPQLTVTAYSAEWLMSVRRIRSGFAISGKPGDALLALLAEAAQDGGAVFRLGYIEEVRDNDYATELHDRNLFNAVQTAVGGRADFFVQPVLQRGRISFQINLLARRGIDRRRNVALEEGANLTRVTLNEQGPIVNQWTVNGFSSGWPNATTISAAAIDPQSISVHGVRQDVETDTSLDTTEAALAWAKLQLRATSDIQRITSFDALDRSPGRFAQYDVGDRLWTELYSQGFEAITGARRLIAREYLAETNTCKLVTE